MYRGAPCLIGFSGKFIVHSLQAGIVLVKNQPAPAVQITLLQIQSYPVLAHGRLAGEIYAYCLAALEKKEHHLEVYAPAYLMVGVDGRLFPLVSSITWYVSPAVRDSAVSKVVETLNGKKEERFQLRQDPFAAFDILE
jgi:hypothetical protein